MKTRKNQLTARQQQFCQVYVGAARRNAALAARMAGYAAASSHVTGCQLLQTPKVAAAVQALEAVNAQELQVTRQQVLVQLQEAAALAKLKAEPMAMVAAWRAIAQAAGLYRPEKTVAEHPPETASALLRKQMENMTDAQLQAIISAVG